MKNKSSMKAFFDQPRVKELQKIQQQNPHGSKEHRAAYDELDTIIKQATGKSLAELGNPY